MSFGWNIAAEIRKTHRHHLRVGWGLASRIVETYSMPVGQHTHAPPQKQQQARMGEPTRVIVLIRLGRSGNGVNRVANCPLFLSSSADSQVLGYSPHACVPAQPSAWASEPSWFLVVPYLCFPCAECTLRTATHHSPDEKSAPYPPRPRAAPPPRDAPAAYSSAPHPSPAGSTSPRPAAAPR
jgi:hypothetical protein